MWSNLTKKLKDFAEEIANPEFDEEEEYENKESVDENEYDENDEKHEDQKQNQHVYRESQSNNAANTIAPQWNDMYGNQNNKSKAKTNATEVSWRNEENNKGFIGGEENLFERAKRLWEVANIDNNTQIQTSIPILPPTSVELPCRNELNDANANNKQSSFDEEFCEVIHDSNYHYYNVGAHQNILDVKESEQSDNTTVNKLKNKESRKNNDINSNGVYFNNYTEDESNNDHNEKNYTQEKEEHHNKQQETYKQLVDHVIRDDDDDDDDDDDANSLLAFTFPAQVNGDDNNNDECVNAHVYPPFAQDEKKHEKQEEQEESFQEKVNDFQHYQTQKYTGKANKVQPLQDYKESSEELNDHVGTNNTECNMEEKETKSEHNLEVTSKLTHKLQSIKNDNEDVEDVVQLIMQLLFLREEEWAEYVTLHETLLTEEKNAIHRINTKQIDTRWRERVIQLEKQLKSYQEANDELRSNYEVSQRELLNANKSVQEWQGKVTSMMEEIEELQQSHDAQERQRRQQDQVELERISKLEEANAVLQTTCHELEKKLSRYPHDSKDNSQETSEQSVYDVHEIRASTDGNAHDNNKEKNAVNTINNNDNRKVNASDLMKSMEIIKEAQELLVRNLNKYKIRFDEPNAATREEEEEESLEEFNNKYLLYLVNVTLSEFVKARTAYLTALNVQSQWEQTYEQAKNVNSTLNSDLNVAHATINMLTNEASMKEEAVAMLTSQLNSAEELLSFEREKNETNEDKLVSAVNESSKWHNKVEELTEMNNELRIQLNHISVEHEESERVLAQREVELRELQANNSNLQKVLNSLREQRTDAIRVNAANMYKEIDQLRNELSSLKQEKLEHAKVVDSLKAVHGKEMTAKNVELAGLYRKHAELRKALDFSAKQLNGETMIDKSVISHLLVNFIHAFVLGAIDNNKSEVSNKRLEADEMLKVLSGLLNWDEVMQEKAGLLPGKLNPKPLQWQSKSNNRPKLKMLTSLLSRSSNKRHNQEQHKQSNLHNDNNGNDDSTLSRSVSNMSIDGEGDVANRSLAALWVDFLLKESECHATEINNNSARQSKAGSVDANTNNDIQAINTQATTMNAVANSTNAEAYE